MKKGLKIAGAIAAIAALVPYSFYNKDRSGRITTYALLWKSTVEPDPQDPAKRKITVDLGFHNPFAEKKEDDLPDGEADLFEDDASWCAATPVEEDGEPALDPNDTIRF